MKALGWHAAPRWMACAVTVMLAGPAAAQERVLDDFTDLSAWTVSATDDVKATLRSAPAADPAHGRALCIDFDFGHVTGYVTARRALPLQFPLRYEFTMGVRGDAPPNALQFKLVDASGENVWWSQRPDYRFPPEWQTLKLRQRQIDFAWGPTPDRSLRLTESVEFVIASGSGAGRGSACFDRLALRQLPDVPPATPAPRVVDDGTAPMLTVDYGQPREFGALAVRWPPGAAASRYGIELSDDGQHWTRVRQVERARGELQKHWLPDSESRYVRVAWDGAREPQAARPEIDLRDAPTANTYFAQLAQDAPRGRYPRAYGAEQSYWTVLGVDGGRTASLLSEDGVLEPAPGVGALEPFLVVDGSPAASSPGASAASAPGPARGALVSWADARITHTLQGGELPMPSVHWRTGDIALDVDAFGHGPPQAAAALARYTVRNLGTRTRQVTLALAWRPFQANPPTQFLSHPGGASVIDQLRWDGRTLFVNGVARLWPLTAPSSVRIEPAAAGPASDWLTEPPAGNDAQQVIDPAGFASGVLRYALVLRPGEQRQVMAALPVDAGQGDAAAWPASTAAFDAAEAQQAAHWRERLGRVRITGNAEVADIARTVRSALGHILVNRSGPALQPGARAYARSWIRDGALTSAALLRLGQDDVARDFLRWFAPFQFKNGKVPCCATARGADPVPENDSDGELAFAVADLWHHTHDEATVRALWPHVAAAVAHMETLRQSERTDKNRAPERAAYFGLMPPSISHEGYSDKPAYAYWDDFWAYTGYRSAAELAQVLGHPADAARMGAQRDEFLADLRASITASTQRYAMNVLPGAADRGDVDPTSSTMALSPADLLGTLPDALMRATFERYWRDFQARLADEAAGLHHGDGAYTPYEWRNVGALVRLGERERAQEAMAYFYRDRRPAGWNQWAEVVSRDARAPRFLGDMPHGWVASDHIRSVLDLFAYPREGEQSLVLAAGVPLRWFDGPGLAIQGLRTPYGPLSWAGRARQVGGQREITVTVQALREQPPGGITLRGPWGPGARVWVDGRRVAGRADSIALQRTPARVRIVTTP